MRGSGPTAPVHPECRPNAGRNHQVHANSGAGWLPCALGCLPHRACSQHPRRPREAVQRSLHLRFHPPPAPATTPLGGSNRRRLLRCCGVGRCRHPARSCRCISLFHLVLDRSIGEGLPHLLGECPDRFIIVEVDPASGDVQPISFVIARAHRRTPFPSISHGRARATDLPPKPPSPVGAVGSQSRRGAFDRAS